MDTASTHNIVFGYTFLSFIITLFGFVWSMWMCLHRKKKMDEERKMRDKQYKKLLKRIIKLEKINNIINDDVIFETSNSSDDSD